ncbi:MAG TPA: 1,4-alpha-glucan branching protein GlgB [Clostridia bacterium]|nr:1,4-alpha-glucan branching protein GlgB [Clostridia bacterium]
MKYFTEDDIYYFRKGEARAAYGFMGCSVVGKKHLFSVWAPNASKVTLIGEFNEWNPSATPMEKVENTGIWAVVLSKAKSGMKYKFHITGPDGNSIDKADPYAFYHEQPPYNASIVQPFPSYGWTDNRWMEKRKNTDLYHTPISIYEVHSSSFRRGPGGEIISWSELADELIPWVLKMGFTHIELMPVTEYPFEGSWGYQVTGYFAPTSRHGNPEGFMEFIDRCHAADIGVILDWVPGHFPRDQHGLWRFDGTPLYEHPDPLLGEQPQWDTAVFDYTKNEVRSFLVSSALFWLKEYHLDGLRVDAVSSMLYRSFGREETGWLPNESGGDENPEGVEFIKILNSVILEEVPDALMIAEESTSWQGLTKPVNEGGLGFSYKWNMGWMNDILNYIRTPFNDRPMHYSKLTFSQYYSFSENYILPFSHDEVIHGKLTLLDKMPGSYEQKFAGLRTLLGYMYAHPGLKLLFMGNEMAPFMEWRYYEELEWHLLKYPVHDSFRTYLADLNDFYMTNPPLWDEDHSWNGFRWVVSDDPSSGVIIFERSDRNRNRLMCIINFMPYLYKEYMIPFDTPVCLEEVFSSEMNIYSGIKQSLNFIEPEIPSEGKTGSHLPVDILPLSVSYFKVIDYGNYITKEIKGNEVDL